MNVKLILAPDFIPRTKFTLPPMGIASIAASLRNCGYQVDLDDLDIRTRNSKLNLKIFARYDEINKYLSEGTRFIELEDVLNKILSLTSYRQFGVVGLSVVEPSQLITALCLAKRIKEETNAIIVVGGRVSVNSSLLKYHFIDYVISGDAEQSFISLMKYLEGKEKIENIPGLIYRENGIKQNSLRTEDLNHLPAPDFDGLPMELYRANVFDTRDPYYETYDKDFPIDSGEKLLILPYLLNKGCCFSCSFCAVSASNNRTVLHKNPKKISEDILRLSKKYNTKYFFFVDSTINCDYKWLSQLSAELSNTGLLWSDSATPQKFDKNLLMSLRKAGCVRLTWGVESLCDQTLRKMNKPFTSATALETLKNASNAGIWNYTNWVAGFPHETEKDLNETLVGIRDCSHYIDDYTVTGFILQNSDMYNNADKYGIRIKSRLAYLDSAKDRMETDSYDEINGLTWNDKQLQISNFRKKMVETLSKNKNLPLMLPLHTIFYLYAKFHDKEEIKRWVRSLF